MINFNVVLMGRAFYNAIIVYERLPTHTEKGTDRRTLVIAQWLYSKRNENNVSMLHSDMVISMNIHCLTLNGHDKANYFTLQGMYCTLYM